MVPQGLGFWSHWIFWLWLCRWSCGPQVNIWYMSFPRTIFGLLVLEERNCVSLSTTEAEYIAAGSCCAQLLWMKQTLKDYGINMKNVPLYCDTESAIKIAHNPVQHSKTKHIQIRHHFLHDHVLKDDISIDHVSTEDQLADIFTKPLDEKRFSKLRCELNILESSNVLWKGHSS